MWTSYSLTNQSTESGCQDYKLGREMKHSGGHEDRSLSVRWGLCSWCIDIVAYKLIKIISVFLTIWQFLSRKQAQYTDTWHWPGDSCFPGRPLCPHLRQRGSFLSQYRQLYLILCFWSFGNNICYLWLVPPSPHLFIQGQAVDIRRTTYCLRWLHPIRKAYGPIM